MKKIVYLGIALCLLFLFPIQAEASTVKQGAFEFTYDIEGVGKCCITEIKVLNANNAKILTIPSTLDGLKVVNIGWPMPKSYVNTDSSKNVFKMFCDTDGSWLPDDTVRKVSYIEEIVLPDTLEKLDHCCFEGMSGLKKIVLPKKLKSLGMNALTSCPNLKEIHIPKEINKNVEDMTGSGWTKFTVAKKNKTYKVKNGFLLSKNGKKIYGMVKKMTDVKIPEGVTKIPRFSFFATTCKSIHIPSTVVKIQKEAFAYIDHPIKFTISKKNKYYAKDGNCIYSKRSGRLVIVTVKNGTMKISPKVTVLKEGTCIVGKKVKKIIIPSSVNKMGDRWCGVVGEYAKVYMQRNTPPTMGESCYECGWKVYVPKNSYKKYKKAFEKIDAGSWVKLYKIK